MGEGKRQQSFEDNWNLLTITADEPVWENGMRDMSCCSSVPIFVIAIKNSILSLKYFSFKGKNMLFFTV